jgi:ferredoxin
LNKGILRNSCQYSANVLEYRGLYWEVKLHLVYLSKKGGTIMAHVVSDECVSCGACAAVCPVEAISEGPTKYVVDPDTCIDCGACEEPCPTGAIAAE